MEFTSKLEQYKEGLKRLSDELDKLKHAEASLPEGTSVVQLLSGTVLDDLGAAYVSAVENFERTATSVSMELGVGASSAETSIPDASAAVSAGQLVSSQSTITSFAGPITSHLAGKASEEKEGRIPAPKTNIETRKTGRKLVRPRLVKPDEPQGDVEMSEVDGSNTIGKPAPSHESESQRNLTLLPQPSARKRQASSASELNEQPLNQGEPGSNVRAPVQKRPKGSNSSHEGTENLAASPSESPVIPAAVEEALNSSGDVTQGSNGEGIAEKEDVETSAEKGESPKELEQLDELIESQNEKNDVGEENLDKASGSGMELDGSSKDQAVEDNPQSVMEFEGEKEEGELVPDVAEGEEGGDVSNMMASPEIGEVLAAEVGTTPVASPARIDEDAGIVGAGLELGEINSPEVVVNEEKNDEGDLAEEAVESSDKSTDAQIAVETDPIPETASVTVENAAAAANVSTEVDTMKQVAEGEDVKQASPASNTSTVVNLAERAKERAMLRQSGATVLSPSGSRGRGRAVRVRGGRILRGGRAGPGRGHTTGPQG
ncbi:nuclear-pore anchor [Jatropha curcas]|nr:nuclear-pore anchor [Jatropha curcas]